MTFTPLPAGWEADILAALGAPADPTTIGNLDIWQAAEGGSTANPDAYNPFNTALPEPGSVGTGSNVPPIQRYPSWSEGLAATVATIDQPNMAPIANALRTDAPRSQFEGAVAGSPWGTKSFPDNAAPAAVTTGVVGSAISGITGAALSAAFGSFASSLYGIAVKGAVVAVGAGLVVAGAVGLMRPRAARALDQAAELAPLAALA